MSITFDHTIIAATDRNESAQFYVDVLEATSAPSWGQFTNIILIAIHWS